MKKEAIKKNIICPSLGLEICDVLWKRKDYIACWNDYVEVNINILHVNINKPRINIIMLHDDINLAWKEGVTIIDFWNWKSVN